MKGTSYDKRSGKWRARIRINGVSKHLGCFDTQQEASDVYNDANKRKVMRIAEGDEVIEGSFEELEVLHKQYLDACNRYKAALRKYSSIL